jgi:peptide methionine sulfoxide reductase msrA/msrB
MNISVHFKAFLPVLAAFFIILNACCHTVAQPKEATKMESKPMSTMAHEQAIAVFAEGCFWCSEHIFESVAGVDSAVSGYAGGHTTNPTYREVCGEGTGHAESVKIYYDPKVIDFAELLNVFFSSQDPTTPDQQGPDRGSSYRSVAFYQNDVEKMAIEKEIAVVNASGRFKNKVVTEVTKLDRFYRAEEYHQNYIAQETGNPYVASVSLPRFEKFKRDYKPRPKAEMMDSKSEMGFSLADTSLVRVVKTNAEWKKILTADQYFILREDGTEPSFKNAYYDNHKKGNYFCAGCHLPLFSSETKFESGTGWPSFFAPISPSRVGSESDKSYGMSRDETVCARCGGHLGHVFNDGPKPTGLRYCMDSGALIFVEK